MDVVFSKESLNGSILCCYTSASRHSLELVKTRLLILLHVNVETVMLLLLLLMLLLLVVVAISVATD